MKKTTKFTPSPAPATTAPATAAVPPGKAAGTALKAASATPKTVGAPPKIAAPRIAVAPPSAAPRVIASQASAAATVINAKVDVGFGNSLYIRGSGGGLSWEKGTPMHNLCSDEWRISLDGLTAPVTFKFLINNETWSNGEDFSAQPGESVTLHPRF